jgi:hypothetical protein
MGRFASLFCLILIAGSANAASLDGKGTIAFSGLSPLQRTLFQQYVNNRARGVPGCSDPDECEPFWDALEPGQAITFGSITQALEHTKLKHKTNGLQQIEQIIAVQGDQETDSGDLGGAPFQLRVIWKQDAPKAFLSGWFLPRLGADHPSEWGMGFLGTMYGLHILFPNKDPSRQGHVHIDYRGLGEGHFTTYENDVRAVGPEKTLLGHPIDDYKRHQHWYGPIPGFSR